ncbi:hypothetical protein MXB_4986, partial [Myxobolus squamalis]
MNQLKKNIFILNGKIFKKVLSQIGVIRIYHLCDGTVLVKLYESISGKKIDKVVKTPKNVAQKLDNITLVMKGMNNDGVKFVNIGPFDICNGNPKLILALVWHMILYYQMGFFHSINDNNSTDNSLNSQKIVERTKNMIVNEKTSIAHNVTPKALILKLINFLIPQNRAINLTTDWNSGKLLAALIEKLSPGSCPSFETWNERNSLLNVTTALCLAEVHLGIPVLIEPHHMVAKNVDELSMITYLSSFTKEGGVTEKYFINNMIQNFINFPLHISNMTTDWNNGVALCEIIKACNPSALKMGYFNDFKQIDVNSDDYKKKCITNIKYAMDEAKRLFGIESKIEPELFASKSVPALAVMSYISSFLDIKKKIVENNIIEESIDPGSSIQFLSNDDEFFVGNELKLMISNIKFTSKISINVSYEDSNKSFVNTTFKKLYHPEDECYFIDFVPSISAIYKIDVDSDNLSLSNSPLFINVIESKIELCDLKIENLTKETYSVGDDFSFNIKCHKRVNNFNCVLEDAFSKKRKFCEITKMPKNLFKITTKIDLIGKYHVILITDDKREILIKTINFANDFNENIKIITPTVFTTQENEKINVKIDTKKAGYGKLEVKLKPQYSISTALQNNENVSVELIENNGIWDVQILINESKVFSWLAHIYWNHMLIPEKYITIHIFNVEKVKLSGNGLKESVQINTDQIYVGECGKISEITGIIQKISLNGELFTIKNLTFTLKDRCLYETSYQLSNIGTYYLKVYFNNVEVGLARKKIEAFDLNKLSYQILSHTGIVGDKIDVKMIVPVTAGKGDLFYAMEGPEGQMKVFVEPLQKDEENEIYLLSSVPNKVGEYRLILHFGGLEIPGFPKCFSVSDANLINVKYITIDQSNLKVAVFEKENTFDVTVLNVA